MQSRKQNSPSLFAKAEAANRATAQPLAARMRPRMLAEFSGQQHFLAPGKLLHRLIKADRLGSVLFYGPPGTGKTTLARLLAVESKRAFRQLNAVTSGVKEVREILEEARTKLETDARKTLLFIDEIHRFNKSQQDLLLPDVEEGVVTLVGATTANPFFAVNSALVSRSQIFEFKPLSAEDIRTVIERALADVDRGLGKTPVHMHDDAMAMLIERSDGDARRALAALEIGVLSSEERPVEFSRALAEESFQRKAINYDPTGDGHYDTISALIKSIRGSDPDAGLYWLAKMLEAGEDVRFLCRRLIILASEDIGNADPAALPLAIAAMQACEFVGLPECELPLGQAVCYLACAPKSNASAMGIWEARKEVREGELVPVPMHLRDGHYAGAKRLGSGEGYQYAHDATEGVAEQDYLGVERTFYKPTDRGFEVEIGKRLDAIRARLRKS